MTMVMTIMINYDDGSSDGGGGNVFCNYYIYIYAIQTLLQTTQTVNIKDYIQSLKPSFLRMEWMSMDFPWLPIKKT